MSKGNFKGCRRTKGCVDGSLEIGRSALMTRLREKSAILHYIDSADRGEVDIGFRSSHMQIQRELFFARARPEARRLSYTNPMHDINQRHVAPTCASGVRTTYAYRIGLCARRSQALGRR